MDIAVEYCVDRIGLAITKSSLEATADEFKEDENGHRQALMDAGLKLVEARQMQEDRPNPKGLSEETLEDPKNWPHAARMQLEHWFAKQMEETRRRNKLAQGVKTEPKSGAKARKTAEGGKAGRANGKKSATSAKAAEREGEAGSANGKESTTSGKAAEKEGEAGSANGKKSTTSGKAAEKEGEGLNPHEQEVAARIAQNNKRMKEMGVMDAAAAFKASTSADNSGDKRKKKKRSPVSSADVTRKESAAVSATDRETAPSADGDGKAGATGSATDTETTPSAVSAGKDGAGASSTTTGNKNKTASSAEAAKKEAAGGAKAKHGGEDRTHTTKRAHRPTVKAAEAAAAQMAQEEKRAAKQASAAGTANAAIAGEREKQLKRWQATPAGRKQP